MKQALYEVAWFSALPLSMIGLALQHPTILSFAVLSGTGVIASLIERTEK